MTVLLSESSRNFPGSNNTGPFQWSWRFFKNSEITVSKTSGGSTLVLAEGADYTLTGAGTYAGGSLTLTSALMTGETLHVVRNTELVQETDLRNQGDFFAETHEDVFDRLTMIDQDHARNVEAVAAEAEESKGLIATLFDMVAQIALSAGVLLQNFSLVFKPLDVITKGPEIDVRSSDLATAAALAVSSGKALKITTLLNITVNTDLSAVPRIKMVQGGTFNVSPGVTLTVPKDFRAGDYQVCFTGSGSVAGLVRVRPEWFGGRGDGVTDNSAVLLKCLATIGTATQGTIAFSPGGSYYCLTRVDMNGYSNKTFEGNGAELVTDQNIDLLRVSWADNVEFSRLNFRDSYGAAGIYHAASSGVYLYGYQAAKGVTRVSFYQCGFKGFKYGLKGMGNSSGVAAPIENVLVSRCFFTDNYAGLVALGYYVVSGKGSCHSWTIDSKTRFYKNWHWGAWSECGDVKNSNYVQDFNFTDVDFVETQEEHGIYQQGRNFSFTNCNFMGCNSAGIRSFANPGLKVTGCYFEGCGKNLLDPGGAGDPNEGHGYQTHALMIGSERAAGFSEQYEGAGIGLVNNRFYDNYAGIQAYCDKTRIRIVGNEVYASTSAVDPGIDLQQVGEGIIALNTSSSNAGDGLALKSYGGGGSYAGRSDYVTLFGNTTIGNAGYGLNIPAGASNFFRVIGHTSANNVLGDRNIGADSRDADISFSVSFSAEIAAVANATTHLLFNNNANVMGFRAFAGLVIKGISVSMGGTVPTDGGITIQPLRDGGMSGMGAGPLFHHGGARVYSNSGGLGYVLVTENLTVDATTSSDYAAPGPVSVVVNLLLGHSASTFYNSDYGPEKIANGTFALDASWTKGGGADWAIAGGQASTVANAGGSPNDLFQNVAGLTTGIRYRVIYTIVSIAGGSVYAEVRGNGGAGPSTGKGTGRNAPGTYDETITAGAGSYFRFHCDAGVTCTIDNVSVTQEIN